MTLKVGSTSEAKVIDIYLAQLKYGIPSKAELHKSSCGKQAYFANKYFAQYALSVYEAEVLSETQTHYISQDNVWFG